MNELQCKTLEVQNLKILFRGFAIAHGVSESEIIRAINTAHNYAFRYLESDIDNPENKEEI